MRHVLVPGAAADIWLSLDSGKLKHFRQVLRMDWDEELRVTDGAGRLFEGKLEESDATGGGVRLGRLVRQELEPAPLELAISLPKNATMDWLVEKAVECGATSVCPVISSRSVVRPDPREAEKYLRRWQAIMDGAVEQSEKLWRPRITAPSAWGKWLGTWLAGRRSAVDARAFAFASESRGERPEQEALSVAWTSVQAAGVSPILVLIGPEGGFTEDERSELKDAGFVELSLGATVLRVETAVVTALTLVRFARCIVIQR